MKITSPEPFWLVKNGLVYSYPSLQENKECDILIVGSGITGSLIAHELTEKGYNCILIDKRHAAQGSTSATTSMLQYEIDVPLHELQEMIGKENAIAAYKSCASAINQLQKVVKSINSKCGFEKKKSLYFAAAEKDLDFLKKEFEARKEAGFKVSWIEEIDLKNKYGLLAPAGILSAIGGSLDAYCLSHDLLQYNIKKGLEVYDHTHLIKTANFEDHSLCTLENGKKIKANKVIFCSGYETVQYFKNPGIKLLSTFACVSEQAIALPEIYQDTLLWNTADPYLYLRTTSDGRLLIGGEDIKHKNGVIRDHMMDQKRKKLVKKLKEIIPGISFTPDFVWSGTFGSTKDGLPYIGAHPDYKNCFFVLGFGGNGITFSVAAMKIIADLLKGKKNKLAEIFRFGR